MKARLILLMVAAAPALASAALPAREAMAKGQRLHGKQDFAAAAELFAEAAQQAPAARLDAAPAHYNHGHALYREGRFDEAFDAFARARQTTDLGLQARALYNAANCRIRQVDSALEAGQGEYVPPYLAEAQTLYEQALLLAPGDEDIQINLELTQARQAALQQGVELLRRALRQAEEEIGKYAFDKAYALLQDARLQVATALLLKGPESKTFETMMQRCQQVLGILRQTAPGGQAANGGGGL